MSLTDRSEELLRKSFKEPRLPALRLPRARLITIRTWSLPVALLVALVAFVWALPADPPLHRWFFWRYPPYWALGATWTVSCFCAGHAAMKRVLSAPLPVVEHFAICLAAGVLIFFLLMFAGGIAMAYGPTFFVALPAALILVGGRGASTYLRRLVRHLRHARARSTAAPNVGATLAWTLGIITLFLYYLPCVVPSHIGYDSAWYHVPLGEHYARLGGIRKLEEGWVPGAMAQLPSLLYCWAFLLPRGRLFDYVEVSAHIEFFVLLMTLPGIVALVHRIVPRSRAHTAWIALFAFPSMWWYDLLIGGDQMSALWSAPIALALLRFYPSLSWRHGLVLAMAMSGEALTKYSAAGILVFPTLAILVRTGWLLGSALLAGAPLRSALGRSSGGAVWSGAILLLTTPLWAKNWLWYGDPFFPLLRHYLTVRPFTADAEPFLADFLATMSDFRPPPTWQGVRESLLAMVDHSFRPSDFSQEPYRGSLFTLLCGCLPFVRASGRLWATAITGNVAVFAWYWQAHQDRYLMAFMPLMAAVVAAVVILAWRSSHASRVAVVALVVVHTVWGLGAFTLADPVRHYRTVIDFVVNATQNRATAGMEAFAGWNAVGKSLPKEAKVLVHGMHLKAGLGHPSVSDWPQHQTGISYGRLRSAAETHRHLRSMGVTHVVWSSTNWADDSIAGDLRFYELAVRFTSAREIGGMMVGALPDTAPPDETTEPFVAYFGCDDRYKPGLYRFSSMTVPNPRRQRQAAYPEPSETFTDVDAQVARAGFVALNGACALPLPNRLAEDFVQIGARESLTLYVRAHPAPR